MGRLGRMGDAGNAGGGEDWEYYAGKDGKTESTGRDGNTGGCTGNNVRADSFVALPSIRLFSGEIREHPPTNIELSGREYVMPR